MNEVEIRKSTYRDWRDLACVHSQAYCSAYKGIIPDDVLKECTIEKKEVYFQKLLVENKNENGLLFVNHKPVGYITIQISSDAALDNTYFEIKSLYVLNDFLGMGFGKGLILWGIDRIVELGYSHVFLWVLQENTNARRFYEKMGFIHDGVERIITRGKELVQLRYQKRIQG